MKLQDLKRGMRCTFRNGIKFIYNDHDDEYIYYLGKGSDYCKKVGSCRENLKHKIDKGFDIVRVDDVTLNGYETIWERKEEKFYLVLPKSRKNGYQYLNFNLKDNEYSFNSKEENETMKTQFTEEEIKELPNQDFIQSLEKEPIK